MLHKLKRKKVSNRKRLRNHRENHNTSIIAQLILPLAKEYRTWLQFYFYRLMLRLRPKHECCTQASPQDSG